MKNRRGFTQVELLAAITIMALLLVIAIPTVSRTVENSRRDSFAMLAKDYLEAVENNVMSEDLVCNINNKWVPITVAPKGKYFFPICTNPTTGKCYLIGGQGIGTYMDRQEVVGSTTKLFDSLRKSPFGDRDLSGYVVWEVTDSTQGESNITETSFKIRLEDQAWNGFEKETPVDQLKRKNVKTRNVDPKGFGGPVNNIMFMGYRPCKLK